MKKILLSLIAVAMALPLAAQDAASNPISAAAANAYKGVATNVLKAIEKMPADKFGFKATPEVMAFSEFAGHLADANYMYCTTVSGAERPKQSFRKETDKAALVAAFKGAMEACMATYAGMTDAKLATKAKMGPREVPVTQLLIGNTAHTNEHYGNMVTYLRMNNLVPPSSEGR